ncbi:MAG: efflux RND transporter periplasmic adaptor subunit [Acidithiobacillales bacterium]
MSPQTDNGVKQRPKGRLRRIFGNLAWVMAGVVFTILLIANPLHFHPLDNWIHSFVSRWHTDHMQAPPATKGTPGTTSQGERKILFYRNPMNPAITSPVPMKDEMGMDYVPVYAEEKQGERKILFYRNPMNPAITSPVPAKDEMGMDYVPVYADEGAGAAEQGATVSIDPAVVQNMNVQTELVTRRDVTREIRTVGYLDYDQQKMVTVTTKYPGWVEKVFVNYLGEPVREGQRLFEIYSPELVQTEQDLVTALAFVDKMKNAPEDARRRAEALVSAARTRLAYWDISASQIERLEAKKEVFRTLVVTAPASGLVMKRLPGLEGMAVKPGMELFHIADLSSLWLSVEVFEDQLAWLKVGSVAEISLSYFPGERFRGRVRFIEPQVSEKTRTVPLRLEVPNPDGRLRSGMFATVRFHPVVARRAIAVPSVAVLRTGERNLVIVALGEGRFAPRTVELGGEGNGFVDVLSGLKEGDRVATSAQFLIDSESNLREALQKMIAASKGAGK